MIIATGNVLIYNTPYIVGDYLRENFKTTLLIRNIGYICQVNPLGKCPIRKGEKQEVELTIIGAEYNILEFLTDGSFVLVSSETIGEGKIDRIRKVVLEKKNLDANEETNIMKIKNQCMELGLAIEEY